MQPTADPESTGDSGDGTRDAYQEDGCCSVAARPDIVARTAGENGEEETETQNTKGPPDGRERDGRTHTRLVKGGGALSLWLGRVLRQHYGLSRRFYRLGAGLVRRRQ